MIPKDPNEPNKDVIQPGKIFAGKYEIVEKLGSGGVGTVFKAKDLALNRLVALKILAAQELDHKSLRRFQQEARSAAGLSHPGIVTVYEFAMSEEQQPYLVMDFIDGMPLSNAISQRTFSIDECLSIALECAKALEYAHSKDIIHRDIKPANIMLLGQRIKLVDFGLAKDVTVEGQTLTETGEIFGSPLYMSPEQCSGGKVDARSDIYSLGCVLYEMLTGMAPLMGENALATAIKHLNERPKPLGEIRQDLPQGLDFVVGRTLKKDPADRYQSASAMIEDLEKVLRRDPLVDVTGALKAWVDTVAEKAKGEEPNCGVKFLPQAFVGDLSKHGCALADDDQFYKLCVQYALLARLDVRQMVQFRVQLVHRAAQVLHGKSQQINEILWSALSIVTEKYFAEKARLHSWPERDAEELKHEWFEFLAMAFLPSSTSRKLEKSAVDTWASKFAQLNKRGEGPLSICGPCTSKCQYRCESLSFITHSTLQADFDIEITKQEKPKDELVASFLRLQTMRLIGQQNLDIAYCLGAHLVDNQKLTSDDKLILVHKARERLDQWIKEGPIEPSPAIKKQVLDIVVKQASAGSPWRQICAAVMEANKITPEEVEAEIAKLKSGK